MKQKIILAGGPSTGKSSVISHLKIKGYPCLDESFRELLDKERENDSGINFGNTPLEFSYSIFSSRKHQYKLGDKFPVSFFDRSLIDVLAYLDMEHISYPIDWQETIETHKYHKKVFYFPMWKDIYTQDDHRLETWEEALKVDRAIRKKYINEGYHLVEVPLMTVEKRTEFILNTCFG